MWDSFLYITIELGPIIGGEGRDVNFGVGRVKDKVRVIFLLEVSHHVESSFEVAFTRISKMWGEERYFSRNVDAAKLNHPTGHTNKVLVEWQAFRVKWFGHDHLRSILVTWEGIVSSWMEAIGALKDGYIRSLPLPRVPQIQSQSASPMMSHESIAPKAGIPLLGYVHIPKWIPM
jgi:hypothetical protein